MNPLTRIRVTAMSALSDWLFRISMKCENAALGRSFIRAYRRALKTGSTDDIDVFLTEADALKPYLTQLTEQTFFLMHRQISLLKKQPTP